MAVGEWLLNESTARLRQLRGGAPTPSYWLPRLLRWGAWLNYAGSVVALAAGLTAGWHFTEIGFDLMMHNVSEPAAMQPRIIKRIPAWILVHQGRRR